ARIEQQAAFDFLGVLAVALVTMLDEDGADLFLEELDAGLIGFKHRGPRRNKGGQCDGRCQREKPLADCCFHARCEWTLKICPPFREKPAKKGPFNRPGWRGWVAGAKGSRPLLRPAGSRPVRPGTLPPLPV